MNLIYLLHLKYIKKSAHGSPYKRQETQNIDVFCIVSFDFGRHDALVMSLLYDSIPCGKTLE